jgi:hypothetical protein
MITIDDNMREEQNESAPGNEQSQNPMDEVTMYQAKKDANDAMFKKPMRPFQYSIQAKQTNK